MADIGGGGGEWPFLADSGLAAFRSEARDCFRRRGQGSHADLGEGDRPFQPGALSRRVPPHGDGEGGVLGRILAAVSFVGAGLALPCAAQPVTPESAADPAPSPSTRPLIRVALVSTIP